MASILQVQELVCKVSGYTILNGLNLTLEEGEMRVVLGPNGAGKTTMIDMISGRYKPFSGKIIFGGKDITGYPSHKTSGMGIGRKFQVPNIYVSLTVYENVMICSEGYRSVFGSLFHRPSAKDEQNFVEILDLIGLADKAQDEAGTLSHGERQWLEIGMLVSSNPKLLLLDEPTTGMTVAGKAKTAELIKKIAKKHTLLVVEHDMHFIRQIASKITVLHQGRVIAEGAMHEVENDPKVKEIYLGKGAISNA
jgi:urea transport system ATP-binding protein